MRLILREIYYECGTSLSGKALLKTRRSVRILRCETGTFFRSPGSVQVAKCRNHLCPHSMSSSATGD
uniref:FLYWCH-type domain-containing protein n=1 Tax=Steinernema glaseri TaxID=37863 RepID=A0A1I7YNT1_9BILA